MKAFLVPSFKNPYKSLVEIARYVSDKETLVTDDFHKIEKYIRSGKITKVVIIMGAGRCPKEKTGCLNPLRASELLKKANPEANIIIVDGRNWHIPGQFFLPGKSTVDVLKKALMS